MADPYWSSVVSLMHLDTNTPAWTDDVSARAWTATTTVLDTTTKKFGTASAGYPTTGVLSSDTSSAWTPGTGDYTVEGWIYATAIPTLGGNAGAFGFDGTSGAFILGFNGVLTWRTLTQTYVSGTGAIVVNTWYHVAFSRVSGVGYFFINGVQVATAADTNNLTTTRGRIGYDGNANFWVGNIDEVRTTKGVGRYNANFTAPTAAFPGAPVVTSVTATETVQIAPTLLTNAKLKVTSIDGVLFATSFGNQVLATLAENLGAGDGASTANRFGGLATESMNILGQTGFVWSPGGLAIETLGVGASLVSQWAKAVIENLAIADHCTGNFHLQLHIADGVVFRDGITIVIPAIALEHVGFGDLLTAARAVMLLDQLGLASSLVSKGTLGVSVIERLRVQALLSRFLGASLVDGVGIAEAHTGVMLAMKAIVDGLEIDAALFPRLLVRCDLAEGIEFTDAQLLQMAWSAVVVEGVEINIGYFGINGEFSAWSMNTRTGAVSEYQNFDFNSFARVDSKYIGASTAGVYELLGDDDAGVDIISTIRGGYMQFGGTHLSRLKEAYIAIRAPNSQAVMKIVTADGAEYIYEVDTRSMRNTKVHMGKGQKARYFAFELVTVGQDFDLDTLEFVPIVLQRRV